MRIVHDLSEVGSDDWNALLRAASSENPFVSFEFLHALHESGCASARTGWEPHYLDAGTRRTPVCRRAAVPQAPLLW